MRRPPDGYPRSDQEPGGSRRVSNRGGVLLPPGGSVGRLQSRIEWSSPENSCAPGWRVQSVAPTADVSLVATIAGPGICRGGGGRCNGWQPTPVLLWYLRIPLAHLRRPPCGGILAPWARQPERWRQALIAWAQDSSAEVAARVAGLLGDRASSDPLIRRQRAARFAFPAPCVWGVGACALRRGRTVGMGLVDLKRRRPGAVLGGRPLRRCRRGGWRIPRWPSWSATTLAPMRWPAEQPIRTSCRSLSASTWCARCAMPCSRCCARSGGSGPGRPWSRHRRCEPPRDSCLPR
jgi:hypothetical protein